MFYQETLKCILEKPNESFLGIYFDTETFARPT